MDPKNICITFLVSGLIRLLNKKRKIHIRSETRTLIGHRGVTDPTLVSETGQSKEFQGWGVTQDWKGTLGLRPSKGTRGVSLVWYGVRRTLSSQRDTWSVSWGSLHVVSVRPTLVPGVDGGTSRPLQTLITGTIESPVEWTTKRYGRVPRKWQWRDTKKGRVREETQNGRPPQEKNAICYRDFGVGERKWRDW